MKQIVKPGDRVYCPFCGDSYDADELVSSHRSPQVEMRCASCGREFEFVVDETSSMETTGAGFLPFPEAVHLLCEIYENHPEELSPDEPDRSKVREIGQRLYESGGLKIMTEVHHEFAIRHSRHARNLEMVWDGIGEWMG
jgi:hypothetical protein